MGTYLSAAKEEKKEEECVESIILDALTHGWTIDAKNNNTLTPPLGFVCRGWGSRWTPVHFKGLDVLIPDYIHEEPVRRTGTRKDLLSNKK